MNTYNTIFDKNMKWNLYVHNIEMRMRLLSFSFYKLRGFLPTQIISDNLSIWLIGLGWTKTELCRQNYSLSDVKT